jgi:hypothetical protein
MAETVSIAGNLTMEILASTLSAREQRMNELLTALKVDPAGVNNLADFADNQQPVQQGQLTICAAGAASKGAKVLSTTAYVSSKRTAIDVYRLPVGP